jgi:hypothetical protein
MVLILLEEICEGNMMQKKSFYNNLFDSIFLLISNITLIVCYLLVLIFGIFNKTNNYLIVSFVIATIMFVFLIVLSLILIIRGCFEKITIDEKNIYSKKPFKKIVIIHREDISETIEKQIPAVILGTGKTNALIIKSSEKVINVYLDKHKTKEKIIELIK